MLSKLKLAANPLKLERTNLNSLDIKVLRARATLLNARTELTAPNGSVTDSRNFLIVVGIPVQISRSTSFPRLGSHTRLIRFFARGRRPQPFLQILWHLAFKGAAQVATVILPKQPAQSLELRAPSCKKKPPPSAPTLLSAQLLYAQDCRLELWLEQRD